MDQNKGSLQYLQYLQYFANIL